ncbi:PAS domain S-box protein [Roseomonas sp. KE2513]|uniref:PAS domain S-box protein n=1 Tax=Roseomonas sp. KE2513 TaxID=2479202 RepID=UPI0018E01F63|nr:PAS domain S-box protein [Roseomonas sp. KE2513]MBI0536319.1 PAS domain S-box protein [Roseomonas sp. KE2513]
MVTKLRKLPRTAPNILAAARSAPRRPPTLRHRLLVFAIAAALPLLLLAGGAVWQQNRAERLRAEEALVARAHAMALLLDREFAVAEQMLRSLSGSPALARGDFSTFWSEMRGATMATGAKAVNLVGSDGRIRLSTSWMPGERPGVMSTGPAGEALATGRTVVSNLFVSPSVGGWAVAVAVPVMAPDAAGEQGRQVLGLVLPRERLLSTLTDQRLPPEAVAAALDRELTIVARTARDHQTVASKPPAEVLAAITAQAGVIPPYAALEGGLVHGAYALAPQSGFRVKVSVPEAAFEAPLRRALLPTLLIGSGLILATLVFSILFADRLARSLRRLGEPGGRGTPGGHLVREIDELSQVLARRAEERERVAARLRALFDASPVGVLRSDAGGRVSDANDAFLRIVGMTREDLAAGRVRWDDLTPPEWIGRDEDAISQAARSGSCAPYEKEFVRPDGTRVPVLMFFAFHDRDVGAASAFVVNLSGRAATEAALLRLHERMRLAIGAAGMFFWDWNIVTGEVEWSEGLEELCGLRPGGFGRSADAFMAMIDPEDRPRVQAALSRALSDDAPYDVEFRMRRGDGRERWVLARGTVHRDGTGRPTRMVGIDLDITGRKATEAALAESEARARHALEEIGAVYATAPVGLGLIGRDHRFLNINAALAGMNGLPREKQIGRPVAEVVPELWAEIEPVCRAVLERGEAVVERPISGRTAAAEKAGHWLASFHPVHDGSGAVWGISLVVRSVPPPAPRASADEAWLRDLLATLDLGAFMARDLDGKIRFWSSGCERLYGWTAGEAIGKVSHSLLRTAFPMPLAEIEASLERTGEWHGDLRHRTRDGREVVAAAQKVLRRRPDGTAFVLELLVDVTAQRTAESELARANTELERSVAERTRALKEAAEELIAEMRRREVAQAALLQAQKLEVLGQLTGSVAHDFNNVLAAVMGSLQLIARRAGGNQQILNLARGGEQAAERAAALIRQLMAFARREEPTPVVISPAKVLEDVDQMLRRSVGMGVTLALRAAPDAWPVLADPHRLEVALLNLAVNARDAMQGAGTLRVEVRNSPVGMGRPEGLYAEAAYVVFSVRDSGPGMSAEVLARATEPFFTTKPLGKGTGLGLATVQSFAQQSGGVLRLLSTPGQGATAELWLPRAARGVPLDVEPRAEPDPALHGGATLLVVDDEDQVRLVVATQLRDLGYEVIEADGLASAMVQALAAAQLDLVITDVTMPGGRGPELAQRLRAARPGVPVLFVSGYGDPGTPGSEIVLAKPFTPGELARHVLSALGRLPAPAAPAAQPAGAAQPPCRLAPPE